MDPNSARQKVMRYYKEEDPKEIDPDKENWNESKSLLDNILADLRVEDNFNEMLITKNIIKNLFKN